jgi:hypothetical protein
VSGRRYHPRPSSEARRAALVLDKVANQVYDMPLAEVDVRGETVDLRQIYPDRRACPRCKRTSA